MNEIIRIELKLQESITFMYETEITNIHTYTHTYSTKLTSCNGIRTHKYLARKRTLNQFGQFS